MLDVVGKLVDRLVQNQLQQIAESELPDTQCGFRKGRSCTDQIFSARQLIEKFDKHRTPGFLAFIDLKRAYDSVSREALARLADSKRPTNADGHYRILPPRYDCTSACRKQPHRED